MEELGEGVEEGEEDADILEGVEVAEVVGVEVLRWTYKKEKMGGRRPRRPWSGFTRWVRPWLPLPPYRKN